MDLHSWRREVLPSSEQTTFSPLILPISTTMRKMEWLVTQSTDSVHVGVLSSCGYSQFGPPWHVLSLHLGNVG